MLKNIVKSSFNSSVKTHFVRAMSGSTYKTLAVSQPSEFVTHVELNRPDKFNSFNDAQWTDIKQCFEDLNESPECRAIVLTGAGKHFTAGLDLKEAIQWGQKLAEIDDSVRKGAFLEKRIKKYQVNSKLSYKVPPGTLVIFGQFLQLSRTFPQNKDAITSLELCNKPVIISVHSACVGAGASLASAADIRYCTDDAWFTIKEVDIGLAADVGALQRCSKIIGNQSLVRELCFTGRNFDSKEALACGFVSRTFSSREEMIKESIKLAEEIASKSPVAVQATKKNLVYSLDHTNQEGLDQIREINRLTLQGEDFVAACIAQATKGDKPVFAKL